MSLDNFSVYRTLDFSADDLSLLDSQRVPVSGKSLLENSSSSVVVFAERMLGIKLYYWEIVFLCSLQDLLFQVPNRFDGLVYSSLVANTSRQIGKSSCLAIFSLWAALFNKRPDKRYRSTLVEIVSRSDVQSRKLLREIKKTMFSGNRFLRRSYLDSDNKPIFGDNFFTDLLSDEDPNNATQISFAPYDKDVHGDFLLFGSESSSCVKCHPPTDTVLGESFTIGMIDEAAHKDIDNEWVIEGLMPTGDANDALWMFTSTPWEPVGFFYEYCDIEGKFENFDVLKIVAPIHILKYDVDAGHKDAEIQYNAVLRKMSKLEKDGKSDSVRKAYLCEFIRGESSFFDPDNVHQLFDKEFYPLDFFDGECDMGVDFGGESKSRTVITISRFNEDSGFIERLYHRVYNVGEDINLIGDIKELLSVFNVQRIIPDDCPQGYYRIREMEELGWNVTPMKFRTDKVKKYTAFRAKLRKGLIKSYKDDNLKTEMMVMEYSNSSKQSVLQHAPGYSDDMIDSFVMSCFHFLESEDRVEFYEW